MEQITQEVLRAFIKACRCPFCQSLRVFKCLASHTSQKHYITPYELREMAGLNRGTSICDPDYSEFCKEKVMRRPLEELLAQLKLGRTLKVVSRRETAMRPEGKENQRKWLFSPRHLAIAKKSLSSPAAVQKSRLKARTRSPKVVADQTERIITAHKRWLKESTPGEIKESRQRGYQTWIKNTSAEYVKTHLQKMCKMVPHEAQVKAAAVAKIKIPLYHADPEWKAKWQENMMKAYSLKAKVPRSEYPKIAGRYMNGESSAALAAEYHISHSYVRLITKRVQTGERN